MSLDWQCASLTMCRIKFRTTGHPCFQRLSGQIALMATGNGYCASYLCRAAHTYDHCTGFAIKDGSKVSLATNSVKIPCFKVVEALHQSFHDILCLEAIQYMNKPCLVQGAVPWCGLNSTSTCCCRWVLCLRHGVVCWCFVHLALTA